MNDPNKTINVNLSSLLSLKAELLRKKEEVNKAKATKLVSNKPNEYTSNVKSYTTPNSDSYDIADPISKRDKKLRVKELEKKDDATVYEHEDSELIEKSRRVLEAKSKFYERMTRTGGHLNSDDNCLVLFNRKHQDDRVDSEFVNEKDERATSSHAPTSDSDTDSGGERDADKRYDDDDDEDWVEYTDCLGRTRKCLREDLEVVKRRDTELAASMPERLDQSKANWMLKTNGTEDKNADDDPIGPMPAESVVGDGISMMSKHDEQRANWERKEQENVDKIDVHYQDVFFDEARQHGVGYYAFSTDEEERNKQQKELEETRKRTMDEQRRREELRVQREKIIAERVLAAKNRQRARLGLPPLAESEEDSKNKDPDSAAQETKEERKARKRAENFKRKQEQEEKERELERQQYVRPWDEEKVGITRNKVKEDNDDKIDLKWAYRPERLPMSQEEWNEKKRAERITEFGPVFNEPSTSVSTTPPTQRQYQLKRTHFTSMPPPPPPQPVEQIPVNNHISTATLKATDDSFATHQTSKRNRTFHRRNFKSHKDTHEEEVFTDSQEECNRGAAIPPPIDLDYVTPPQVKKPRGNHQLEQSIEAGLRFLRDNCDQGNLTTKSSWTAKADY